MRAGTPLSDRARAALADATVTTDGVVQLHTQLARSDYEQANMVLGRIAGGGSWNRQRRGHIYPPGRNPAAELRDVLTAGVIPPDPKQQDGWFATPTRLAESLAFDYALPGPQLPTDQVRALEPSAGEGALADALCGYGVVDITCVEPDPYRSALLRGKGYQTVETTFQDWVATTPNTRSHFNIVLMNPPFTEPGDQLAWITHITLAWELLAPGGRLVAVCPASLEFRTDRRTRTLRELVERTGDLQRLPADTFKQSGTNVRTVVATINRPPDDNPAFADLADAAPPRLFPVSA
jgi:hypothetical protein